MANSNTQPPYKSPRRTPETTKCEEARRLLAAEIADTRALEREAGGGGICSRSRWNRHRAAMEQRWQHEDICPICQREMRERVA